MASTPPVFIDKDKIDKCPVFHVYTDGSCPENPGNSGWAYVCENPINGELLQDSGMEKESTNNRGELLGALYALHRFTNVPLVVYSDSNYLVKGITSWVKGWKRNGWRTKEGKPVLNKDLWEKLDKAVSSRNLKVNFVWVKGHSGNRLNELADELAVKASGSLHSPVRFMKECPRFAIWKDERWEPITLNLAKNLIERFWKKEDNGTA